MEKVIKKHHVLLGLSLPGQPVSSVWRENKQLSKLLSRSVENFYNPSVSLEPELKFRT